MHRNNFYSYKSPGVSNRLLRILYLFKIAWTSLVGVPNDANDIHINPHKTGELAINRTGTRPVPTLFEIIGAFKSITTNRYINCVKQNNWPRFRKRLWQLKYHDRVIRDENELGRIRKYIINNPLN